MFTATERSLAADIAALVYANPFLEARIEQLTRSKDDESLRLSVAEAANHRREIRLARAELERLGCRVVGTAPLTIRIPGRVGSINKSFVWRTNDPALR